MRGNKSGEVSFSLRVPSTVIIEKVRRARPPSHQLKEPPHEEPLAYPRRTWEVELVAEGRRKDEVVHVW